MHEGERVSRELLETNILCRGWVYPSSSLGPETEEEEEGRF